MAKPLITLTTVAVMLYGMSLSRAADFGDGLFDTPNNRPPRPFRSDLYEQRSSQDVISELQSINKNQKMNEAVKNLPSDDPLHARWNKRLAEISSTNFTANTNSTPIEIVPGLSGGK